MFEPGTIWAYPTDTSFGLGVRCDDREALDRLFDLKVRDRGKPVSLMTKNFEQLKEYAEVPEDLEEKFFFEKPRTVILKPTDKLPKSEYWPEDKVAFRVCTMPAVANHIEVPITATSANISGETPIFQVQELEKQFGDEVEICRIFLELPVQDPSEIYDFTVSARPRLR